MNIEQRKLQSIYLDWVNNFLTVERFAEVYGLTIEDAKSLIEIGRRQHENIVATI